MPYIVFKRWNFIEKSLICEISHPSVACLFLSIQLPQGISKKKTLKTITSSQKYLGRYHEQRAQTQDAANPKKGRAGSWLVLKTQLSPNVPLCGGKIFSTNTCTSKTSESLTISFAVAKVNTWH